MTSTTRLGLLLLVPVLFGLAWVIAGPPGAGEGEPAPGDPAPAPAAEGAAPMPGLEGTGRSANGRPAAAQEPFDALRARTTEGGLAARHAAFRQIQARYAAGKLPLEHLVDLLLAPPGEDAGSAELRRWAIKEIGRRREEAQAFLSRVLAAALGASEPEQDRVGEILRAIHRVRPTDVPAIGQIFAHAQSGYGLKRILVDMLDELGPPGAPLADPLMDFLREALVDRRQFMKEAMEAGIHVSWDHVEFEITRVLGQMGAEGVPTILSRLQRALANPDALHEPTGFYADALAEAGPAGVQALLGLLSSVAASNRLTIAAALAEVPGPNPLVRESLVGLLAEEDSFVRREGAKALAEHGPEGIPALLGALTDREARVRHAAAGSLKELDVSAQDALAALVKVMGSGDRGAANSAAETIAGFGRDALPALPEMIQRLDSKDAYIRGRMAEHVAKVALYAPDQLAGAYDTGSEALQRGVIETLQYMTPLAPALEALLGRALTNPALSVRVGAAALLLPQGHGGALAPLLQGFESGDGPIRSEATFALADGGAAAAPLLQRMMERLGREDLYHDRFSAGEGDERTALNVAIEHLGVHNLPLMLESFASDNFEHSFAAGQAFTHAQAAGYSFLASRWPALTLAQRVAAADMIGTAYHREGEGADAVRETVRTLARLALKDPAAAVRIEAISGLERDPSMQRAMRLALLGLLNDEDEEVTSSAGYQLSRLGAKASSIETQLRTLRDHPHRMARFYVIKTLDAIEDARK